MSAGLDVDAAAMVAELQSEISDLEVRLRNAKKSLTLWKRVDFAVRALDGTKPSHGPSNAERGRSNERCVLDLLADGQARRITEIAAAIDRPQGTLSGVVARLVKRGQLESPAFALYRLKSASPPPSRPAPAPAAPAPAKDDDATLIPAALVSDIDLEPLRGAAPQARCPKCLANKSLVSWSHAIGLRNGRYLYRCPACRATFHTNAEDRPK